MSPPADGDAQLDRLKQSHTPSAIRERLASGPNYSYLRDFIYGAIDGAVTTFAVVSGVAGANLPTHVIVILGLANLVGDGFSMAVSNYQGTKADRQLVERARRTELAHIRQYPEGEREEVRQILHAKGFVGEDLERAVEVITSQEDQWVDMMLREELGLTPTGPSPGRAAMATFTAFLVVGFIPLLPFVLLYLVKGAFAAPFLVSAVITGGAFFAVGAAKAPFIQSRWYLSGAETLLAGGSAAALAYMIGALLGGLGR